MEAAHRPMRVLTSVARTLPALVRFYADFSTSGLALADHRGYGQSACKAFGLIPAPKLSVRAMAPAGPGSAREFVHGQDLAARNAGNIADQALDLGHGRDSGLARLRRDQCALAEEVTGRQTADDFTKSPRFHAPEHKQTRTRR